MNLLERPRGRRALFASLYFVEGAPIGFVFWALPVVLREGGASPADIGALSGLLVLPWALKFAWAPLVDLARTPRFGERGWIVASQLGMIAALVPLFGRELAGSLPLLRVALLAHAFAAATQDVAIDALAVRSVPSAERGSVNGWMNAGMMLGRSLFAGGAIAARKYLGDGAVLGALVACLAASLLLSLFYRSSPVREQVGSESAREFARRLASAFSRRATWLALLFAAIGGAGFEGLGAMAGPLLVDAGARSELFFLFIAPGCTLVGGLAGGRLSDRSGRRGALAASGLALNAGVLGFAALVAWSEAGPHALMAALGAVYVGIGLFTAASYAFFMDLTDPALGSTQFSAYMGATNLCESWSAGAAGQIASCGGYGAAFAALAIVSVGALGLLLPIPRLARSRETAPG